MGQIYGDGRRFEVGSGPKMQYTGGLSQNPTLEPM